MEILSFEEGYVKRMWGGEKLRTVYKKNTPEGAPIGEAWIIADHEEHESRVDEGPFAGRKLCELLAEDARAILGNRAELTTHGRFPLLLKLLDAGDKLSIQVHPDDTTAKELDELDVGKTEMWYVLQADQDSELYCGMSPDVDAEQFANAIDDGTIVDLLKRFQAREGMAVFVPAGTVHAIGGGALLAEIQQNSDVTYRIDDWGRVQPDGTPRPLHIPQAKQATHFGSRHAGASSGMHYTAGTKKSKTKITVLAACRYFAGELVEVTTEYTRDTRGDSFHLLLGKTGELTVANQDSERVLRPGKALLVPGSGTEYTVRGEGAYLNYYVPDLERDVIQPLIGGGNAREYIVRLGGDPSTSDLA